MNLLNILFAKYNKATSTYCVLYSLGILTWYISIALVGKSKTKFPNNKLPKTVFEMCFNPDLDVFCYDLWTAQSFIL